MDVVAKEKAPTVVKLEPDKINALLGTELSEGLMREILVSLGFILNGDDIYVPSWRGDVEHYSDIAEEVARFYGYNKIPCTLMRGETTRGGFSEQQRFAPSAALCARWATMRSSPIPSSARPITIRSACRRIPRCATP